MYPLSALGFCPFFEEQLSRSEHPAAIPARIAAEYRGAYAVWSASGAGRDCLSICPGIYPVRRRVPTAGDRNPSEDRAAFPFLEGNSLVNSGPMNFDGSSIR